MGVLTDAWCLATYSLQVQTAALTEPAVVLLGIGPESENTASFF